MAVVMRVEAAAVATATEYHMLALKKVTLLRVTKLSTWMQFSSSTTRVIPMKLETIDL